MEINKFYSTVGSYIKIFFLIYNGKYIGAEFNSETGKYITDYWSDIDNEKYYITTYKVDLTQPRRNVIHMIFLNGGKYL